MRLVEQVLGAFISCLLSYEQTYVVIAGYFSLRKHLYIGSYASL
jgi:hypothetical protein